ncbi:MAG: DUF885 domain-containing protein [Chromatiales bacterium]|jgi:uncharacterized protein (DUF885 family)
MIRMRNGLCIVFLALAVTLAGQSMAAQEPAYASVDDLFAAYYQFRLRISPTEATKLGESGYNDKVANYISAGYQQDLIEQYQHFLRAISGFDDKPLSPADALSLRVMRWDCEIKRQGLQNPIATVASPMYDIPNIVLMPVAQIASFNLFFGQLASGSSIQPFATVTDYDNWLRRVDGYIAWLDTAIDNMQIGVEQGVVWPKVLVERSIAQLDDIITDDIGEHLYFRPVLQMPATFSAAARERLTAAYTRMIETGINPAHRALREFLVNDYLPRAGDHTGLGALPHGRETYRYLIRYHTSTDMTADEIFELGQREVARISEEMEKVMRETGFDGDLRSFFDHVRASKTQMPFTDPAQVIANFEAIHDTMKPHIGRLFGVEPKAGFEVRRTEAFRENSASAEYLPGSKDGTRPGVFYVPIPDVRKYNKFADESLFLHEAIPGHHYQLSLQQENQNLPEFLHPEGMGVFVEGWALYSESLGKELGLYRDPYQYFGMLSAEMHRAIRLVVDTGMHAKGWTRQRAIQYSLDHEAESEASIVAEIERYMAMPGQALSYKIGQLKIRELRSRAEQALGDEFDIRAFHSQVLDSGSLPLVLLEEKIDAWIAASAD